MLGKGKEYLEAITTLLDRVQREQGENIAKAADIIAEALIQGHALFAFGAVHSSLPVSDIYIRAGGLALLNIVKIPGMNSVDFDPPGLWIAMERLEGLGRQAIHNIPTHPGDVIIVVSVSGRNPVPVEVAMTAKEKGMRVIAVTAMAYTQSLPSRHSSGRKLYEFGDVVIDCLSIPGDAILQHEKVPVKFCATSGVIDTAIMQTLMAETVERLVNRGFSPPVFIAGNLDGYENYKRDFIEQLKQNRHRIFYTIFEDIY